MRDAPEYPAPTMSMSHSAGSDSVERWLSKGPGEERQKDDMPFAGGKNVEAILG